MGRKPVSGHHLTTSGEDTLRRLSAILSATESGATTVDPGASIVACATLVEAHADRSIKGLFQFSGALDHGVTRALYEEIGESIYKAWPTRHQWLIRAFEIKIGGEKFAQDFDVVVNLRNSIVHGGGHLTSTQVSKIDRMVNLKKRLHDVVSVECLGRKLSLSKRTLPSAVRVCCEYVKGFDEKVLDRYPMFDAT